MEASRTIGRYLVAGPAAYEITEVTDAEVVAVVRRPEGIGLVGKVVRFTRAQVRVEMRARALRLCERLPTHEEVEAERRGRLDRTLAADRHTERRGTP